MLEYAGPHHSQATLALIKPDAAERAREIEHIIEQCGLVLITRARMQLTADKAAQFYAEHEGKPFFANLVAFMSSGPLVALVLAGDGAIQAWRQLMGPTNSLTAKANDPRSLRALFGTDGTRNATHGSDSAASAAREIAFFFPALAQRGGGQEEDRELTFLDKATEPILVRGLTALAHEQPTADPKEAQAWLGRWLLAHDPHTARAEAPVQA